jgi:chromate transporter
MPLILDIAGTAFVLSMLAVGGAIAIVPELFRIAVENRGWLSAGEFNELFAISQASPGPSVMILALVGWRVAGPLAGALAMIAFVVPSSIIAVLTFRKLRSSLPPARAKAVQRALAPISCALVASSGVLIARNMEGGVLPWAIAAIACAWAASMRVHPLLPIGVGAVVGAVVL